jgi:hypothetical protein
MTSKTIYISSEEQDAMSRALCSIFGVEYVPEYHEPYFISYSVQHHNFFKGCHHTEEHKAYISSVNKGRIKTAETRKKLSEARSLNWRVVDPNGVVYETNQLNQFCREHDLHYSSMRQIACGERRIKTHRGGWTCQKAPLLT